MRMWPWGNQLCGGLHWLRGEGQVAGGQSSQKRMPDSRRTEVVFQGGKWHVLRPRRSFTWVVIQRLSD